MATSFSGGRKPECPERTIDHDHGQATGKLECHNITEILFKVALNTINQPNQTNMK
jgi:hypothetical protein